MGEIPYSLVPFAVFLYVTLPTRCVRRPVYMKRIEPVARAREAEALEEGQALLRAAEQAAEGDQRTAAAKPPGGRAHTVVFEETFEETFN